MKNVLTTEQFRRSCWPQSYNCIYNLHNNLQFVASMVKMISQGTEVRTNSFTTCVSHLRVYPAAISPYPYTHSRHFISRESLVSARGNFVAFDGSRLLRLFTRWASLSKVHLSTLQITSRNSIEINMYRSLHEIK